ncbi:MAG: extracellular solute-binding protein [Anaerolineales bacterium]|nr:extracellular solute-binding protein [Anaerolineales bacterium]
MSKKFRLLTIVIALALIAALVPQTHNTVVAQDKVTVTWFVGLGTGGNDEQVAAQEAVVAEFNETVGAEKGIELVLVLVQNDVAYDTLSTLIATEDQAPDIVGPVGIRGSNSFDGNWVDMEPLAEAAGYDLGQFPPSLVDFYRVQGQGLIGLPFGVFPSMMFYNRDLFDAAGLPYPPQSYGEPYADGEEWSWDKVSELALLLTLDANGNDATSPDFDPDNIVQFGYSNQWSDARRMATFFGAADFIADDGVTAEMPENWAEFYRWLYDGIWNQHFIPNDAYVNSDLLAAGNPFSSGNVAMSQTHLWYTCCTAGVNFDLAVQPSYNGVVTAPLHADTFRILKQSQNPEAAFEVLTYLIGDASLDLLAAYGGMPARPEDRDAFLAGLNETFTQGVNWQVAIDSLNFPDNPSHESNMPNFQKADERIGAFQTLIQSTPDLDIDAEMATLISDLQAIYDEVQ